MVCFFLLFINVAAAQENQTITLADNGRTITLNVNETFLLNLGEGYDWNITIDDQTIFSRVVNVLVGGSGNICRSQTRHADSSGFARMPEIAVPVCQAVSIIQGFCGCGRAGESARDIWF